MFDLFAPTVVPVAEDEEEDVIRCICGVYRDEGIMIQCEKCFVSILECSCLVNKGRYSYISCFSKTLMLVFPQRDV